MPTVALQTALQIFICILIGMANMIAWEQAGGWQPDLSAGDRPEPGADAAPCAAVAMRSAHLSVCDRVVRSCSPPAA